MSDTRRRSVQKSDANKRSTEERGLVREEQYVPQPQAEPGVSAVHSHSRSKPFVTRSPASCTLLLAILSAIIVSLIMRGRRLEHVPDSYAICSKEGNIYTVDNTRPQVECIVIHKGRILATGKLADVRKRFGDSDKTGPVTEGFAFLKNGLKFYFIEPGHIVTPGLTDAHAHFLLYGWKKQLELENCSSATDAVQLVKDYVLARPDVLNDTSICIQGMGWDQTKWSGSSFPTAADFDKEPLLHDRLIVLHRVDGHAIWVSSAVIKKAGKLPETVEGGDIIRDGDGHPTGLFVDNAMALIKLPDWTDKDMMHYYGVATKDALAVGLTSIHDADTTPQMITFLKRMADENKLLLRLYLMGNGDSEDMLNHRVERFVDYGPARRLTLQSVKLFTDGALGSWGAALLEPYSDRPDARGLMRASPEAMSKVIRKYWDVGFQVNVHCIGDRANNAVLDIFESLLDRTKASERRPRIEHAQIMTADDLLRTARLGVIPSVQPTHATSDMWYAESRLGARVKYAYAYKTFLEAQAEYSNHQVLPLGSDFPVEGINPLLGFYAAVSRLSVNGDSPHGTDVPWFPEQRLTRAEALRGMTLDAAYASFNEERLGSLQPGKLADFVVLDTNIMTVPVSQILSTRVVATVVDGKPMYGTL